MEAILRRADTIGARTFEVVRYLQSLALLIYLSIRSTFFGTTQGHTNVKRYELRQVFAVVSMQIYFTGCQALPMITVLSLAAGGVAILQSSAQLSLLGGTAMLGNILVVTIVRELGPLITALIVIARSGAAVASEIGNMRVNREIEALELMGINPTSYIVFPRIAGGVISVLCLAFYFDAISLIGGFFVSRAIHDLPFSFYFDSLANAFAVEDVFLFFVKNGFSGLMIFAVACYQGLSVQMSSHEVPQVTTRAVVHSIVAVTSFSLLVSVLFYVKQLIRLGIL
jgi:phospholipid/cholesterol/gamma-HCH transport system permease protein